MKFVLAFIFLIASASTLNPPNLKPVIPLDDSVTRVLELVKGKSVQMNARIGQTYSIKIRGQPTDSFSLFLNNFQEISNVVTATNISKDGTSKDYKSDPNPQGKATGGRGYHVFNFKIVGKGKAVLDFQFRSFQNNNSGGQGVRQKLTFIVN